MSDSCREGKVAPDWRYRPRGRGQELRANDTVPRGQTAHSGASGTRTTRTLMSQVMNCGERDRESFSPLEVSEGSGSLFL